MRVFSPGKVRARLPCLLLAWGVGCAPAAVHQRQQELGSELARVPTPDVGPELADDLFALSDGLTRSELVQAVLERNPDVEAARLGWEAALGEVSVATALPDPRLSYEMGPLSIAREDMRYGQVIKLSQRLPWFGVRGLEGEVALAESEAERASFGVTRLRLALMASKLFDDRVLVAEALAINARHQELVADFRRMALALYEVGRAGQDPALQAEVELARLAIEEQELEARREVIVAQLNGLLHRLPEAALPPPEGGWRQAAFLEEVTTELQARALEHRPELAVNRARIDAAGRRVELAHKRFYPDVEVMGSYNSMWDSLGHQLMVGIAVSLPVGRAWRSSAVDATRAQVAQERAQLAGAAEGIQVEVQTALTRVRESARIVEIYEDQLLPAARARIDAARAEVETARASFLTLIEAERGLRTAELGLAEARANLSQRIAELEKALGHVPGLEEDTHAGP